MDRCAGSDLPHSSAPCAPELRADIGGPGCHLCLAAVEHQLEAPAVAAARTSAGSRAAALRARRHGLAQPPRVARACATRNGPLSARLRLPQRRSFGGIRSGRRGWRGREHRNYALRSG